MEERLFHLRSRARHEGPDNELVELELEIEVDGSWQPIVLQNRTPPYRAFVCTALMCQHGYLRMNATERQLVVRVATGEFWFDTADWLVRSIQAHFKLELAHGTATGEDLTFIAERARDCPISRNLANTYKRTTVELVKPP